MSGLLSSPPLPHFIHSATDPTVGHCCEDEHHHQQQQLQQQQLHHRSLRFANMVTASATMSPTTVDDCKAVVDDSTPADSLDDQTIVSGIAAVSGVRATDNRLPQNLQQLREKLYAQDDDDDDGASCCGSDSGRDAAVDSEGRRTDRPEEIATAETTADDEDDSSDDGCDRRDDCDDCDDEGGYATLSARSVCSATTAANDDFEYFAASVDRSDGGGGNGEDVTPPATNRSPVGGRVPYQRAPTRRARHHQPQPQHHLHHRHQQHPQSSQYHHRIQVRAAAPALPPTPPTPRRPKARLTPVLSVDSLVAAQAAADAAQLLQQHHHKQQQIHHHPHQQVHHHHGGRHRGGFGGIAGRRLGGGGRGHHGGSVPDLKRVFITDFL